LIPLRGGDKAKNKTGAFCVPKKGRLLIVEREGVFGRTAINQEEENRGSNACTGKLKKEGGRF